MTYHNLDGKTQALNDISFHIHKVEIAAIVVAIGCSNSTLLSITEGLLTLLSLTFLYFRDKLTIV